MHKSPQEKIQKTEQIQKSSGTVRKMHKSFGTKIQKTWIIWSTRIRCSLQTSLRVRGHSTFGWFGGQLNQPPLSRNDLPKMCRKKANKHTANKTQKHKQLLH